MNKSLMGAGIVIIIAAILAMVSVALPYYQATGSNMTVDFDFTQVCISGIEGTSITECVTYSTIASEDTEANQSSGYTTIGDSLEAAGGLSIAGGIIAILGGVFCIVASVGIPFAASRKMLWAGLPMIGGLALLVSVILVPVGIQIGGGQLSSGSSCTFQFIYSCNNASGYPYVAWFMVIVAFVLALIGTFMALSAGKKMNSGQYYQQQPFQPGYGGYQTGDQYYQQAPAQPGWGYQQGPPPLQFGQAGYPAQNVICSRCGTPNIFGSVACAHCGTRLY
jgi:hypothetical protein